MKIIHRISLLTTLLATSLWGCQPMLEEDQVAYSSLSGQEEIMLINNGFPSAYALLDGMKVNQAMVHVMQTPQHGTISHHLDGLFVYEPHYVVHGLQDQWHYEVCDANKDCQQVTVNLLPSAFHSTGHSPDLAHFGGTQEEFDAICNQGAWPDLHQIDYYEYIEIDVLANDFFCNTEVIPSSLFIFAEPSFGQAEVKQNGEVFTITYTNTLANTDKDFFFYRITSVDGQNRFGYVEIGFVAAANPQDCLVAADDDISGSAENLNDGRFYPLNLLDNDVLCDADAPYYISFDAVSLESGTISRVGNSLVYEPGDQDDPTSHRGSFRYQMHQGRASSGYAVVAFDFSGMPPDSCIAIAPDDIHGHSADYRTTGYVDLMVMNNDQVVCFDPSEVTIELTDHAHFGTLEMIHNGHALRYWPENRYSSTEDIFYYRLTHTQSGKALTGQVAVSLIFD